jgi:hypothetical protein
LLINFINRLADALNQTDIGLQFGNADKLASCRVGGESAKAY